MSLQADVKSSNSVLQYFLARSSVEHIQCDQNGIDQKGKLATAGVSELLQITILFIDYIALLV